MTERCLHVLCLMKAPIVRPNCHCVFTQAKPPATNYPSMSMWVPQCGDQPPFKAFHFSYPWITDGQSDTPLTLAFVRPIGHGGLHPSNQFLTAVQDQQDWKRSSVGWRLANYCQEICMWQNMDIIISLCAGSHLLLVLSRSHSSKTAVRMTCAQQTWCCRLTWTSLERGTNWRCLIFHIRRRIRNLLR